MTNAAANYVEWGETYLREAAALKARLEEMRGGCARPALTAEQKRVMREMYDMYLECSAVGRLLKNRGKRWMRA